MVDEAVEAAGKKTADGRLAFAGDAAGADLVVIAGLDELIHLGEKGGRILEVGVHSNDDVAPSVVKTGQ